MTGSAHNTVSGGIFFSATIQGRDIAVQLPPQVHPALEGIPARSQAFTGRDTDLDQLMALLDPAGPEAGSVRISAVAGLGGVGKTELALQAAHNALDRGWFPGGVLFVDLFGYDLQRKLESSVALEGMLRAAGIPGEHIPSELQDRSRLFSAVLAAYTKQGRDVLVVLDNASSSTQVRPLLPSGGRALITSRHVLADLNARLLELNVLVPNAAVDLLSKRLHLTRGNSDTRVIDEPESALAIARLCGGLPLALHIVAALLSVTPGRPLSAMATDLEDARTRLDELRYGYGDDELAVRVAFDLSYYHLDHKQARAFRLLTVNPGPNVSTSATAVITGLDGRSARRILMEIARASLISQDASSGERWRMHDLVRIYADECGQDHATQDGRNGVQTRLMDYYLTTTRAAVVHVKSIDVNRAARIFPDRNSALAWLDAEYPNLQAAAHLSEGSHPDVALGLPLALADYLSWRRRFNDWIALNELALQTARTLGDRRNEANVLNNLGNALRESSRFEEAINALHHAVQIFRQLGDQLYEARTLNNLGGALLGMRRFEEAIASHHQAIRFLQQVGDRHGQGQAFGNLGNALREVRRFDEAIIAYQNAARIHQETGDLHGKAHTLHNLASTLHTIGRSDEAIQAIREAVPIYLETGSQGDQGMAFNSLGIILRETGHPEEAITAHQNAIDIYRKIESRHSEAKSLGNLGNDLQAVGRFQDAITASRTAEQIFRELNDRYSQGLELINLGNALSRVRCFAEAISAQRTASKILQEMGDHHSEALALASLGISLAESGDLNSAITVHELAAHKFEQSGDKDRRDTVLKFVDQFRAFQQGSD